MFPKRSYNQTVAVSQITDIRETSVVAKRFSVAAEYVRKTVHTNTVLIVYPTLTGVRQTQMVTTDAVSFLLGVAAFADLVVELAERPEYRDGILGSWMRRFGGLLDDTRVGEIFVDFAGVKSWRDNNARRVLAEHNCGVATLVRQSSQTLRAVMS